MDWLTTGQIARRCGTTPVSVVRWIKARKLKAIQTPGGRFRIRDEDFQIFLKQCEVVSQSARTLSKSTQSPKILIVDDDSAMIRVLSRRLGEEFTVESARDGYEAGLKAGRFCPDLVLLDVMMPGLSGFDVCRNLRSDDELNHAAIVVISGFDSPEFRNQALLAGANAFLAKPLNFEHLHKLVGRMIPGRTGVHVND